jgi:hypothetical protein
LHFGTVPEGIAVAAFDDTIGCRHCAHRRLRIS